MKHRQMLEQALILERRFHVQNVRSWQTLCVAMLMVAAIAGLVGCASTKPVKYYQLGIPNSAAIAPSNDSGVTLTVANLSSSHLYQQDGIVYTGLSGQMGPTGMIAGPNPPLT